jgi:methylmalonyl-CoA/ethylmalonyl-CoA epimerase
MRKAKSTKPSNKTVRKELFTETMQIGIVVRDLDAAVRKYEDYGIGPWQRHQLNPEDGTDVREYGRPAKLATRFATAMVGHVMWELIEPLDGNSIFGRFLTDKGEGVHHIALETPRFDEALAKANGRELPFSGTFSGIDIAYLPTERDLGVIIEIFRGYTP